MRENKYLEFKEQMTDTFLKTVSAYARTLKEKVPYNTYREALANALVHRTWDGKDKNN